MVTVLLSNLVVTWHVEISGVHPHPQPTFPVNTWKVEKLSIFNQIFYFSYFETLFPWSPDEKQVQAVIQPLTYLS